MAEDKALSYEEARAKDKQTRKQDIAVCILGICLVILAKILA